MDTRELTPPLRTEPVAAQVRFRRPEKGLADWSVWQQTTIKPNMPAWSIDSAGYEVEYRLLYTTPQPSAVQGVNQQLLEAATESLDEIQAVMQEAYNSAMPVCCGRGRNECCGSPDPEWNEHDQRTMDRFAPIERALRAAIAAAR